MAVQTTAAVQAAASGMNVTDYLALYAAIVSTVVFLWEIRRSRPNFKVRLGYGISEFEGVTGPGLSAHVLNVSSQPVFINPIGILALRKKPTFIERCKYTWKYKRYVATQGWVHIGLHLYNIEQAKEIKLEPGQSFAAFIPASVVSEISRDGEMSAVKASAQNGLGENRYSKSMDIKLAPLFKS